MVCGLVESVPMAIFPLYVLKKSDPFYGTLNTFWEAGTLCLTAIVIIVNLKVKKKFFFYFVSVG